MTLAFFAKFSEEKKSSWGFVDWVGMDRIGEKSDLLSVCEFGVRKRCWVDNTPVAVLVAQRASRTCVGEHLAPDLERLEKTKSDFGETSHSADRRGSP